MDGLRRDRRSPRAAVYPMQMMDVALSPKRVRALHHQAASLGGLDPLAHFWVDRFWLRSLLDQGKRQRAHQVVGRQRFAPAGLVLGPFPDPEAGGLGKQFGPDRDDGVIPKRRYQAGRNQVMWRPIRVADTGCFRPARLLRPVGQGVVYLAVGLVVSKPVKAAFRVGSNGDYELLVGRTLVGRRTVHRPLAPDQDVWPVSLHRGWYVVKVKLAARQSDWSVCLRVTDLSGRVSSGLRWFADPVSLERASAMMGPAGSPLSKVATGKAVGTASSVGSALAAALKRTPGDSRGIRQYVEYLLHVHPKDPRKGAGRSFALRLVAAHPSAEAYRLLAEASRTRSDRVNALSRAVALDARNWRSWLSLARESLDMGRYRDAMRQLRKASALAPGGQAVLLARAELLRALGLTVDARKLLAPLVRAAPWRRNLVRLYASLAMDTDHRAEARRVLQGLVAQYPADEGARRLLIGLAKKRMDASAVVRHLRALLTIRPWDTRLVVELADVLSANGWSGQAVSLLRRTIGMVPRDAALHAALGRAYLARGNRRLAARAWKQSLRIEPNDEGIRRRLAMLSGDGQDQVAKRYRIQPSRVLRRSMRNGVDAEVLWDRNVYVMRPDGNVYRFRQRFVRIGTQRGAQDNAIWTVSYQPDSQKLTVLAARVHRASGGVEEATASYDQQVSDPSVRIYYDWNLHRIQFPRLRPGDTIEVCYSLSDVGSYNPFAGYFGVVLPLEERISRRHFEVVVEVPRTKNIYFNRPSHFGGSGAIRYSKQVRGTTFVHRWTLSNVEAYAEEPLAPGWSEIIPYLHISTFRSWDEVSRWYWGLVKDQYQADDAIRRTVQRLTAGLKTKEQKVAALYRFVTQKVRYVALEFGVHTHKPYSAPQVLERRFGDCKDKAMLLVVMLSQVGIKAYPVLVRSRFNGSIGREPASLAVFDHAIVYVPALHRYLDGTAEFTGSRDLPYMVQGVSALVVLPRGGRFVRLPVLSADSNKMDRQMDVTLRGDGSAEVSERLKMTGQMAAQWRYRYQTRARRRELFEKALGRIFPGAVVRSLVMKGIGHPDEPVLVRVRYHVPHLANPSGKQLVAVFAPAQGKLVARLAPLGERRYDLYLDFPFVTRELVRVRLPASIRVLQTPRTMQRKVGQGLDLVFSQLVQKSKGRLVLARTLRFGALRVPRSRYARFRDFCSRVDNALGDSVVMERRRRP